MLRGVPFEVVGILEPTLSAPDTTAMVPLAAAQELFLATPAAARWRRRSTPTSLASQIVVYAGGRDGPRGARRTASRRTVGAGDDDDERRLRPAGRLHDTDLQRHHRRRRAHQPGRRRPVGHQHDGHERHRADPRDRHQARDRRLASPDHPRAGRGGRASSGSSAASSASRSARSWSCWPTRPAAAPGPSCST